MVFRTWDLGAAHESKDTQRLLREPGRIAAFYNGRPYLTWMLDETGLWREDPKNPGTMLRYLPPELHDGLAWSQPSGDTSVWFQVVRAQSGCPVGNGRGTDGCWRLTVINREEQVVYMLAPGVGPVQVWSTNVRDLKASFLMEIHTSTADKLASDRRSALLAGAVTKDLLRSPVDEVTPAQFTEARDRELGFRTVSADLNGDGRFETLKGLFDVWNMADVEVFDADGAAVAKLTPYSWAHKVTPTRLRNPESTVFLEWRRYPGSTEVGVRSLMFGNGKWEWQRLSGWGLKHAETTVATRANLSLEGLLTVEWDMGDPARHTRVRQYQLHLDGAHVQIVSEKLRPQGNELLYPSDPEGVLQAAYVAAIHNLHEELPQYFASNAVKDSFRAMAGTIPQELTSIRLVRADVLDQWCNTRTELVKPGPDGTAPFLIEVGGSPVITATMGTVTFTTDPQGRPLIQAINVIGRCPNG